MRLQFGYRIAGLALGFGALLCAGTALAASPKTNNGATPATAPPATPPARRATPQGTVAPRTLNEALAATYLSNPGLQSGRATLRATDEQVPQALAGWRPQVVLSTSAGYVQGQTIATGIGISANRQLATATATVTQPIYRGGKTRASTNQAENAVLAQRARLLAQEEQLFSDTVSAYVGVIQQQQLLQLAISNEQVLTKQLQAANDRFRVGEITRTDVAQAEAALAGATAQRETAEGNLQAARATYVRVVGYPPDNLTEPQPLRVPVRNDKEAAQLAAVNNPTVVASMFDDASAKDAIDVAFSNLMPTVNLQATGGELLNQQVPHTRETFGQFTAQLNVPIYQGGSEYAAVRAARQNEQAKRKTVDDTRRQAVQQAVQAWQTLVAARATIDSTRAQIRANEVALVGVEQEALVGSRTTLDVLNAEQALLNSRVVLVQNIAQLVTASYALASAIGRLNARDLNLNVPLYDETAYYKAVRDKLFGTGDVAVDQPGR